MATPNQHSSEILRLEILADARRESERVLERAQQEAKILLANANTEADRLRGERIEAARVEAIRRRELILATVTVEVGRLRLARIEALLESIHNEVRRRLQAREGFDYPETVITLAAGAVKQMKGSKFVVKLSAADCAAFGDQFAKEIMHRIGRTPLEITVVQDTSLAEDGVVIQDAEGRQVWDNRLLARLERMWPELRRQIAIQTSLIVGNKPSGGDA